MWLQLLLLLIYNYYNFITIITKKEVEMQGMYADSNEGMVVILMLKRTSRKLTQIRVNFFEIFDLNLI